MLNSLTSALLMMILSLANKIQPGKSVIEFADENSTSDRGGSMYHTKETTHFITKRAANFENGNIVDTSSPKENATKTFSDDALDNDFIVHKVRLLLGSAATDADVKGASYSNAALGSVTALPNSIKNNFITIVQDQEVFKLGVRELYEGSENGEKWLVLIAPFKLRAKVPFAINFFNSAAYAATEAFRVEMKGIELLKVASSTPRTC